MISPSFLLDVFPCVMQLYPSSGMCEKSSYLDIQLSCRHITLNLTFSVFNSSTSASSSRNLALLYCIFELIMLKQFVFFLHKATNVSDSKYEDRRIGFN